MKNHKLTKLSPFAFGYQIDYSPIKDQILNHLNQLIADNLISNDHKESIISHLDRHNWSSLIGTVYSKGCKGNPGVINRPSEILSKFKTECIYSNKNSYRKGFIKALYFTYSHKKKELTHISTYIYITGKQLFGVLFNLNNTTTSVIKKEIMNMNPRHIELLFDKSIHVNCKPYLHITGYNNSRLTHKTVFSIDQYNELKEQAASLKK